MTKPRRTERRPTRWADCDTTRRCPWVSCRYHLGVAQLYKGRHIREVAPVEKMQETCALAVAERRPHTSVEVADLMHVTEQRISFIEVAAKEKLRAAMPSDAFEALEAALAARGDPAEYELTHAE